MVNVPQLIFAAKEIDKVLKRRGMLSLQASELRDSEQWKYVDKDILDEDRRLSIQLEIAIDHLRESLR